MKGGGSGGRPTKDDVLALLGERQTAPRVADLGALLASTTGKIELEPLTLPSGLTLESAQGRWRLIGMLLVLSWISASLMQFGSPGRALAMRAVRWER